MAIALEDPTFSFALIITDKYIQKFSISVIAADLYQVLARLAQF